MFLKKRLKLKTKIKMKKLTRFLGVMIIAAAIAVGSTAHALTQAQANAIIAALGLTGSQASVIQALVVGGGSTVVSTTFTSNLTIGSTGSEVVALQDLLISRGHLVMPAGVSKGYFGPLTQQALAKMQAANGISPAVGYFGPITRNFVNSLVVVTPPTTTPTTPTTPALQGGAGAINVSNTSVDVESEVSEGSSENVLAFRVEAEDSDVQILNIRVVVKNTDAPNSNRRPDRYLDEIAIYMGSKKVGSVDPRDLTRDGNVYSRNVSLDNAIVREGASNRATFYVVFKALNNIDSLDMATASFDVDVENIRFKDGSGAILTAGTNPAGVSGVTFTDPASQGDVRIRISLGSGNPTERTIQVNEFSTTNNVTLLEFRLKAEARDMLVESLDVDLVSTLSDLDEILADVKLMRGTTTLADVSSFASSTTETITFDLYDDLEIDEDETVTLKVVARLLKKDGNFVNGATLRASLDNSSVIAEDQQGNSITNFTGSANGYEQKLLVEGAEIEFVSSASSATNNTNTSRDFTLVFDVTAVGQDVTVNRTSFTSTGVEFTVEGAGTNTTSQSLSSNASLSGGVYTVFEGQTRRFTLTVNVTTNTTGPKRIVLDGVSGDAPVTVIESVTATVNQ